MSHSEKRRLLFVWLIDFLISNVSRPFKVKVNLGRRVGRVNRVIFIIPKSNNLAMHMTHTTGNSKCLIDINNVGKY